MAASNAAACAEEVPEFSQSGACSFDADETRRPVTSQVDLSTEVKPPVLAWSDVCAFIGRKLFMFCRIVSGADSTFTLNDSCRRR